MLHKSFEPNDETNGIKQAMIDTVIELSNAMNEKASSSNILKIDPNLAMGRPKRLLSEESNLKYPSSNGRSEESEFELIVHV